VMSPVQSEQGFGLFLIDDVAPLRVCITSDPIRWWQASPNRPLEPMVEGSWSIDAKALSARQGAAAC
jgi:hypothetical protein